MTPEIDPPCRYCAGLYGDHAPLCPAGGRYSHETLTRAETSLAALRAGPEGYRRLAIDGIRRVLARRDVRHNSPEGEAVKVAMWLGWADDGPSGVWPTDVGFCVGAILTRQNSL